MSHAEYHEIKAVFEKHGYTYSPSLLAQLADLVRDRDDERTGIAVDGLKYARAGGYVEIDGENLPVYTREGNPANDPVPHALEALNEKAQRMGYADAQSVLTKVDEVLRESADYVYALTAIRKTLFLPDLLDSNKPLWREAMDDWMKVPEFVAAQVRDLLALIPHNGPGSPAARLNHLLKELTERFPKAHNVYSAAPPEPDLLTAIDTAVSAATLYKSTCDDLQSSHEAGFKELYKRTGIKDTGEYRWKWVISELEEFVDDAKAFRFFFDENVTKPQQMTLEYKEGLDRDAPIDFYRQLIKRYISETKS